MKRRAVDEDDDDADDDGADDDDGPAPDPERKLTKEEKRAQKKADKKADKKLDRQEREEGEENKHSRQAKRDEKYAEREGEREEKKEEEAQAELDDWKHLFEIDTAGTETEAEMTVSQGMLGEFITYIEQQKVVEMDELAIHFEMRTQDAIKRIEDLLMMGRIHGVIDDRGKFICITEDEMKKVAKFIKRRGRVSVMDLAVESNKLIDLTPKRKIKPNEEEAAADEAVPANVSS